VTAHFANSVTDFQPAPKQAVTTYRNRRSRLSETLPPRCAWPDATVTLARFRGV